MDGTVSRGTIKKFQAEGFNEGLRSFWRGIGNYLERKEGKTKKLSIRISTMAGD